MRISNVGSVCIRRTDDARFRQICCALAAPLTQAREAYLRRVLLPLIGVPFIDATEVRIVVPADGAVLVARIVASIVDSRAAAAPVQRPKPSHKPKPTLEELFADLRAPERQA